MKIVSRGTMHHYDQHRMLISVAIVPNLWEIIFLFRRMKFKTFVGKGTKWSEYVITVNGKQWNWKKETKIEGHATKAFYPVIDKKIITELQAIERGELMSIRNLK